MLNLTPKQLHLNTRYYTEGLKDTFPFRNINQVFNFSFIRIPNSKAAFPLLKNAAAPLEIRKSSVAHKNFKLQLIKADFKASQTK